MAAKKKVLSFSFYMDGKDTRMISVKILKNNKDEYNVICNAAGIDILLEDGYDNELLKIFESIKSGVLKHDKLK